jgi:ubiquinone/menaquinone biosynthesis C-methylase UbiE
MNDRETRRVQRIWDKMAERYDRAIAPFERLLFSGGREWVCAQAEGDVLEIGVGTGRNLEHYPRGVRITGVDISPAMLAVARERAGRLGLAVDLREGDAQKLDLPDARFDTVVFALSLCSIPRPQEAVAEAKRVLRPGGVLLLLEHVRSPILPVQIVQRLLDPLLVWLQGDHLVREPIQYLKAAGFAVERLERSKLGIVERVRARRP